MAGIEVYGTFDGNSPIIAAALAQAILDDKVELFDDTTIGLFDGNVGLPLTNGNFSYQCQAVIAKSDDINDTGDYPHTHYEIRIEIHLERVPCPDDIERN